MGATAKERDEPMAARRGRLLALLHHLRSRRASRQRTAVALESVTPLDQAGPWPAASYALDHGRVPRDLPRGIAGAGTPWGRERERARQIQGQGRRGEAVAAALRPAPPERVRPGRGRCRHGATKPDGAVTHGGRRQRSGRQRRVMAQAHAELPDTPRFFLTEVQQWANGRVRETWRYR